MRNTSRKIAYIDENEDPLDIEVDLALKSSMEENLRRYVKLIASLAAMSGINIYKLPRDLRIYYLEDDH